MTVRIASEYAVEPQADPVVLLDELSRIASIHVSRLTTGAGPRKAAALRRRGTSRRPTGRHRDPRSEVDELVPMPLTENLRSVSLIQGERPPQTAFRPQNPPV
jgi:hypothetical protein